MKFISKHFSTVLLSVVALFFIAKFLVGCMGAATGDKAPDFETTLIDGSTFKLTDLQGQYVILDFWGSWCGPCIRDNPKLVALHKKFGDDVTIVTVALEKDDRYWKRMADRAGFTWKHQIVEQARVVLASPIARAYGVTDIPAKFIITPEGKLLSGMDFEQMDAYLEASLKE